MKLYIFLAVILTLCSIAYAKEGEASDVIELNANNIGQIKNGDHLVEFYTPWCGFCKKLAPIYEELATKVKGKHNIAKVNCDAEKPICQQFQVAGYPTIKYVSNGKVYDYQGAREVGDFEKFLEGGYKAAKNAPFPDGKTGTGTGSVVELDSVSFAEVSNGEKWFLVFYAPWCGFCKKYMPGFEKVAPQFVGQFRFGKVNCQDHPSLCELYGVPGYPTFKLIEAGGYRDFVAEPTETNIVQYLKSGHIDQPLKSTPWHPIFRMVHEAILEYVYLFLVVTFFLGLALGYTFFAPSTVFPQDNSHVQQQASQQPAKPEKAEKAD